MSYYGQYPFNTNGGALLSKRNYINRKLDEIEQKLLQLGWIEPEQDYEIQESISDEYNLPVESAGALLPYRDKVNKRLDFFEEVISSHMNSNNSYDNDYDYTPQPQIKPTNNYTRQEQPRNNYIRQEQPTNYSSNNNVVKEQEVSKSFNEAFSNIFG